MEQTGMKRGYRALLRDSLKSNETEEWLDIYLTRPIGLALALVCGRLRITPNMITIAGILLGAWAGWLFHYADLEHNLWAVALLMVANFCDSADGQLARLTDNKTLLGRMLDGFASDVWFFCVYVAVVWRIWDSPIPSVGVPWQGWGFVLCAFAGLRCHATQCSLADYYRQIHLWFLKGDTGSELDTYAKEQQLYDELKAHGLSWPRVYHFFYKGYCRKQERLTPRFQHFFRKYLEAMRQGNEPTAVKDAFLRGSRPLMKYTNILTHNTRAFALFVAALADMPYLYPLFEIVVLMPLYWYMRSKHEQLSNTLTKKL